MTDLGLTITSIIATSLTRLGSYLPQFLAGLILILVGLIVAAILKEVVIRALKFLRVENWFNNVTGWFGKIKSDKGDKGWVWTNILAELVRWTVVILFLVPAAEAWGLPRVTDLLNRFLLYIPNVFVAVVAGFVGMVIANLSFDIVRSASKGLGSDSSNLLATVARYSVVFFTALVILNQLGVASDLVRILFTGIVAMLALAGGLAFGLGGQETARKVLDDLRQKTAK